MFHKVHKKPSSSSRRTNQLLHICFPGHLTLEIIKELSTSFVWLRTDIFHIIWWTWNDGSVSKSIWYILDVFYAWIGTIVRFRFLPLCAFCLFRMSLLAIAWNRSLWAGTHLHQTGRQHHKRGPQNHKNKSFQDAKISRPLLQEAPTRCIPYGP